MKNDNYEETLPQGYKEVFSINAKNFKTGLIFNLVALAPVILLVALGIIILDINGKTDYFLSSEFLISLFCCLVATLIYMVLHELVHGIVYKSMTRRKLTFGLSWSCAFCGVPDVYCYRRTALFALIMPFAVFTLLFAALTAVSYFVFYYAFVPCCLLLGLHVGGCSGDLYMTALLLFRYKDKRLLVRDTGPEQFLYLPDRAVLEN